MTRSIVKQQLLRIIWKDVIIGTHAPLRYRLITCKADGNSIYATTITYVTILNEPHRPIGQGSGDDAFAQAFRAITPVATP